MISRTLEVASYILKYKPSTVSYGLPGGFIAQDCHGYVRLLSKTSHDTFYLAIVSNSVASLPAPKIDTSSSAWKAASAIKHENLASLLDLLRNERPIFMTLWDTAPALNEVSTTAEPVGEGVDVSP